MKSVRAEPIAGTIKKLKVGQSAKWPISRLTSVRNTVSRIRLEYQRRFSTFTNSIYITVIRLPDEGRSQKKNKKR